MPRNDPYMRDPNIRGASSVLQFAWIALGAGLGAAASGWFGFSPAVGIIGGVLLGMAIGSLLIHTYGGRATR